MTPSFVLAFRSGIIASRTTKSVMRMPSLLPTEVSPGRGTAQAPAEPSLLTDLFRRGAGGFACREPAAAVLDLLLVAAQLGFELVNGQVHGRQDIGVRFPGDEIVLVLGGNDELDH